MYILKSIGKIEKEGSRVRINLNKQYKKAMKYLDRFSHIHVFYTEFENAEWTLKTEVAEISSVDMGSADILLKSFPENKQGLEVMDIKPYFPCEDSVKITFESQTDSERKVHIEIGDISGEFVVNQMGLVRNLNGQTYIQLQDMINVTSTHIKILWWFHKFDSSKYRKTMECNPPYENAPRTGIFASRSPVRPNPIAMTVAKVLKIDKEQNRIYINSIECFDKTPCIGIMAYNKKRDFVEEVNVPEWLAHWPKWLDDNDINVGTGEVVCKNSSLIKLLEEQKKIDYADIKNLTEECKVEKIENCIFVKGARENNLKSINVKVPYGKITAIVGVSGSGKSSLVKDTIFSECKRRMEYLNDDKNIMEKPDMEYMTGCIPAVMISQKAIGENVNSTVGTYTNAYDYLRTIFASVGVRHCPVCGNEIIPMKKETIIELLREKTGVRIFDLQKQEVSGDYLCQKVEAALKVGEGAFYATIGKDEYILLQTRQKCYHCNRLMFELTPAGFSYLDSDSRCPVCNGTGKTIEADISKIIEKPDTSILDGASSFWGKLRNFKENSNANWMKGQVFGLAEKMGVDLEQPWNKLPQEFKEKILSGSDGEMVSFAYQNKKNGRKGEISRPVEGVCQIIKRLYEENHNSQIINKYTTSVKCNCCNGERLNSEGRRVTVGMTRYPQAAGMSFTEISDYCRKLPEIIGHNSYKRVKSQTVKLFELSKAAEELGVGYLKLSQSINTLSSGEGQRLKLLAAIQHHMTGILYVFDEPSKGLHPKDYKKIAQMICSLKDEGNTIIMVEHNEDMIKIADNIIEIGPGAGERGGYLIGEGTLNALIENKGTQISKYLGNEKTKVESCIEKQHEVTFVTLDGLNYNNLKNINVKIPIRNLTCICGVSGSGKSSLMKGEIFSRLKQDKQFSDVILVDQSAIGRTPRSVLATYIGIMDLFREKLADEELAVERGYDGKTFSFNGKSGQCTTCNGDGRIKLKYLEDSWVVCPECKGKRYRKEVLEIKYKSKNIDELLQMSVEEAKIFWKDNKEIEKKLKIMEDVGMGYLKIGQSSITFSGGEASRLKLAKELMNGNSKNILYLFDEPTTGLHFSDIENLIKLIQSLISDGNTIVAIEHNKQFIESSNWLIELGPGAGSNGGAVMRQGKYSL